MCVLVLCIHITQGMRSVIFRDIYIQYIYYAVCIGFRYSIIIIIYVSRYSGRISRMKNSALHCKKGFDGFRCICDEAPSDVKFRQIKGNGRKFRHMELSVIC